MKSMFHIEFAESLGLCLFCNCIGDDNPTLVGVWDREHGLFLAQDSTDTLRPELLDLFKHSCFCDVCGDGFAPQSMSDAPLIIERDCADDEPPWVGFVGDSIHLHLPMTRPEANIVAGLLEWSLR